MEKGKPAEKVWETPSLDWLHRIRREMYMERKGKRAKPLARAEAEKLAKKYGLKLVQRGKGGAR